MARRDADARSVTEFTVIGGGRVVLRYCLNTTERHLRWKASNLTANVVRMRSELRCFSNIGRRNINSITHKNDGTFVYFMKECIFPGFTMFTYRTCIRYIFYEEKIVAIL